MLNNGLPSPLNISLVANKGKLIEVEIESPGTEGIGLLNYTFRGEVRGEGDFVRYVNGWVSDGAGNVVILEFPALPEGEYRYAVAATDQAGESSEFLCGRLGAWWGAIEEVPDVVRTPNARVTVGLPGVSGRAVAHWRATTRFENALERAEAAAAEAEEKLSEAMGLLSSASAFMASFNKAVQDCIEVRENYLWVGGVNTGHYLRGDDGVTPHIGADGYWYKGSVRLSDRPAFGKDGLTPHITTDGFWAIGDVKTRVRAEGRDGLDGTAIRRVLIDSVDDLPEREVKGVFYYVRLGEKLYDVYAWLEPDGWVNVKETYDIATSEVYGLTKLGTDVVVNRGAPVGTDAYGNMTVPEAGEAVSGTGKVVSIDFTGAGAGVHLDADGRFRVGVATTDAYGVAKISTDVLLDNGGFVGLDSEGRMRVPKASSREWGVVKLSTGLDVSNTDQTYLTSIGVSGDGTIAFNLLSNGALRYVHGQSGWTSSEAPGAATSILNKDERYLGIATSRQFSQGGNRLSLNGASESLLAGVFIASSMDDERESAVPRSETIRGWVEDYAYEKAAVYTKSETEDYVARLLAAYASVAWVNENFYTKGQVDELLRSKVSGHGLEALYVLTEAEYKRLTSVNENGVYLCYSDSE